MKILFVVCVLAFGAVEVSGQGRLSEERKKEFDAQKVAFFTQELDLSPAEAAVFWPLYNEMQKKKAEIERKIHKSANVVNTALETTEKGYAEAIARQLADEENLQKVKGEYYRKMLAVLPASKVWKLGGAEHKFRKQLFDKLCREVPPRR